MESTSNQKLVANSNFADGSTYRQSPDAEAFDLTGWSPDVNDNDDDEVYETAA